MGTGTVRASEKLAALEARREPQRRWQFDAFPYLLLLPSVALIALINIYPFVTGFLYSLQDGTLIQAGNFVGIDNYAGLLTDPEFQHALWFSALFALFGVSGSYVIGLGLALLLNQDIPGRGFFRVALLMPWIIPSIVSIVSWRWLIADQSGLINEMLKLVGIGPVYFLSTGGWAVFSVIVVKIWRSFPFMMLSLLAALQAINREMYEATAVDGAGPWQSFRFITFPLLLPVSIVLWILMTIWSVNDFETPYLLTMGGPSNATENLSVLAYLETFNRSQIGVGAAIAFTTMLILMVFAIIMLGTQRDQETA
ncbi:MAG TPA: sugar ABC transporter permease [Chloroflexota bacterium]|nr:sugar ABC transporter permease [Chloroflexota bacterium]